ncbi:hypothetical protein OEZ85_001928 [Tetradesmus obliquus]|nr:hypothetical protein OEZ85_001928 [Tetradesmus obliquus]
MLGMAGLAILAGTAAAPAQAGEPFLASTGGKGFLADEEQKLLNLRIQAESEARREIQAEREKLEEEARRSQIGKLCATPYGIDIVGITEFIALVGALVGGITARQRKAELERLNEQLRKINMSLRQQARAGTVYAPGLSYAPPVGGNGNGMPSSNGATAVAEPMGMQTVTATVTAPPPPAVSSAAPAAAPSAAPAPDKTLFSMDEEEMTSDQIQCRDALRAGKRFLKEANGSAAMVRFEKALMLSMALDNKVQERRATRGLAAAARLQGQYRNAIKHLERVLEISQQMREYTGDADAYGTIADCYTDLDEFEKAAAYYDKYIQCMAKDGPV